MHLLTLRSQAPIVSKNQPKLQICSCCKIGQGQSSDLIWTNYDGLSPMLYTKFRGNRPIGSGEKKLRVFTVYGRGCHLSHMTKLPRKSFRPPYPRRFQVKFGFHWPSDFGKDVWSSRTTDGRQRKAAGTWVFFKLTYEPSA